jgi:hypothetical protein
MGDQPLHKAVSYTNTEDTHAFSEIQPAILMFMP